MINTSVGERKMHDALMVQLKSLSCERQLVIATELAANIGMTLVPEDSRADEIKELIEKVHGYEYGFNIDQKALIIEGLERLL